MVQIKEIRDLPLDQIVIGPYQVRTRRVDQDIDELAESIRIHGLLSPIIVSGVGGGKFEILVGQRRFLACQKLGKPTIKAAILSEKVSEEEAKVISLTENLIRRDLASEDVIDACTFLYRKYGSVKAVAEQLGLSPRDVSDYIKYDQLVRPLKEMVDQGEVDLKTALRAQQAAMKSEGDVEEKQAVAFAKELKPLSGAMRKKIVKAAQEDPDASLEVKLEKGRKQPKVTQVLVTLLEDVHESLQKYAGDEGVTQDDAASVLIEEGLSGKGYLTRK